MVRLDSGKKLARRKLRDGETRKSLIPSKRRERGGFEKGLDDAVIVDQFQVVTAFDLDMGIALTCGPALKKLRNTIGGALLMINTPDEAPPPLPRVSLRLEDTLLNVGADRFQVLVKPPSHVAANFDQSVKFVEQRVGSILDVLGSDMPRYDWSGVIVEIEFEEGERKSKSSYEAAAPIFDRLVQIDRRGRDLSSFQLQFGTREDGFFRLYTISAFERREGRVPAKSGFLDLNQLPVTGCGIGVIVDMNNKAGDERHGPREDVKTLLQMHSKSFTTIVSDLNLEGLIR